jgi:hypothetical protein
MALCLLPRAYKHGPRLKVRRCVIIFCPHCQVELDIQHKRIDERVHHARCDLWLLGGGRADGTRYGVKVKPPRSIPERRRVEPR